MDNNIEGEGKYERTLTKKVFTIGRMAASTEANGETTKWKDRAFLTGRTVDDTKVSMSTTRRKVMVFFIGKSCICIMSRPDGRKYDGQWLNGKQDGSGNYTTASGKTKQGQWREGKRIAWL